MCSVVLASLLHALFSLIESGVTLSVVIYRLEYNLSTILSTSPTSHISTGPLNSTERKVNRCNLHLYKVRKIIPIVKYIEDVQSISVDSKTSHS